MRGEGFFFAQAAGSENGVKSDFTPFLFSVQGLCRLSEPPSLKRVNGFRLSEHASLKRAYQKNVFLHNSLKRSESLKREHWARIALFAAQKLFLSGALA